MDVECCLLKCTTNALCVRLCYRKICVYLCVHTFVPECVRASVCLGGCVLMYVSLIGVYSYCDACV